MRKVTKIAKINDEHKLNRKYNIKHPGQQRIKPQMAIVKICFVALNIKQYN